MLKGWQTMTYISGNFFRNKILPLPKKKLPTQILSIMLFQIKSNLEPNWGQLWEHRETLYLREVHTPPQAVQCARGLQFLWLHSFFLEDTLASSAISFLERCLLPEHKTHPLSILPWEQGWHLWPDFAACAFCLRCPQHTVAISVFLLDIYTSYTITWVTEEPSFLDALIFFWLLYESECLLWSLTWLQYWHISQFRPDVANFR